MAHLIDKAAVVAEIIRLRNLHQSKYQQLSTDDTMCLVECGKKNICNDLLSFISTLEVKEVSIKE